MNIAGGTHHAFSDKGEGFCLMNDQAIAAQWLLDQTDVNKVLIIDLDVHQGNGTAEIFKTSKEVFTFSMHGEGNYPLKKEISNLDIGLPDNTEDVAYLAQLKQALGSIIEDFVPDFIFYQCGVDVVASDKLGRLALTRQGCKERDRIVLNIVKELGVPLVCTMGGGYSVQIKDIVEAHANTYRLVQAIFY
jgi:acetoin utilization deacetylase AcuC-like enzyme